MSHSVKLLLDTDIGSDVDDAVCLAWLLLEPNCDLLGITTVTGDTSLRASLASALCSRLGRDDIHVHAGLSKPFLLPQSRQPSVPQASVLADWPHKRPKDFPDHDAIGFLQRTIRAHPGEVTLLAIGPLTNIAALFTIDPEIPSLLDSLVIMGGNFTGVQWLGTIAGGRGEWNIWNDPHAAEIVYRAPVHLHRSVGIDVTSRVSMKPDRVREQFMRPGLDLVLDMAKVWFESGRAEITFHDPLAAVTIFEPGVCRYTKGLVKVATSGLMEGYTLFTPVASDRSPSGSPHEVASDVSPDALFDRYFKNFT